MATDTKNKPAPADSDTTSGMGTASAIKTGGDSGDPAFSKLRWLRPPAFFKKKKFFVPAILVLIVIAGGLILGKTHVGQKVYAQVGGHKIYKQDIQNLVGNNKGISDHDAAEVLANKYLYEYMAERQGIKVTDKDIRDTYGPNVERQKTQNKYAYQFQVNELYYDKLQNYVQGVYKGYLLVAHFSRNIDLRSQFESSSPPKDNSAAIAADKKYAKDFITNLYNQIMAHKITWDQAAQMEKADQRIGVNMYTLTHSGPFDTSKATNSLLVPISALERIQKLKAGQTSKPFVVSVVSSVGDSNKTFESYFLVVRMDSKYGGGGSANLLQKIDKTKKQLGYKVYV